MTFKKYTSIESFAHVYRNQQRFERLEKVRYGTKIKLHGTNAGVRVDPDGTVTAQSRSRDITPEMDNAGFATWVDATQQAWGQTADNVSMTFYGEWAGKGIQKGDAVCQLDGKYFFVFSVMRNGEMLAAPDAIETLIPDLDNVIVIPWDAVSDYVDFIDPNSCEEFAKKVEFTVENIGKEDPFIKGIFDVAGPGEGVVGVPFSNREGEELGWMDIDWYNTLIFKAKTEHHAVKKGKSISTKVAMPEGVPDFVDMFVTQARCQQGLTEACDGIAEPPRTGAFLKWMGNDIQKEAEVELLDMELTWKDVAKYVNTAARRWFIEKSQEI